VDQLKSPSLAIVLFSLIMLVGQTIFTLGVYFKDWGTMFTGRFVYGLAGDNIAIAKSALMVDWFAGGEIAVAFGCTMTIGKLGAIINNNASPYIANNYGVEDAFFWGNIVNVIGLGLAAIALAVDMKVTRELDADAREERAVQAVHDSFSTDGEDDDNIEEDEGDERREKGHKTKKQLSSFDDGSIDSAKKDKEGKYFHWSQFGNFEPLFWLLTLSFVTISGCAYPFHNIVSGLLLERDLFKDPEIETCQLAFPGKCTGGYLATVDNPALDISTGKPCPGNTFSPIVPTSINITRPANYEDLKYDWDEERYDIQNMTVFDVRCTDKFWSKGCTKNFCDAQNRATEVAGAYMSVPYLVGIVLAIPVGYLVDRFGRRGYLTLIGSAMMFAAHFVLAHTKLNAVVPLAMIGLAFSAYGAVLWPSIPLVVEPQCMGTAYGVMLSIQNAFLTLIPLFIAYLFEIGGDKYIPNVEILLYSLALCGVFVSVFIIGVDSQTGSRLNKTYLVGYGGSTQIPIEEGEDRSTTDKLNRTEKLKEDDLASYLKDSFS
jgi:MFS family permease